MHRVAAVAALITTAVLPPPGHADLALEGTHEEVLRFVQVDLEVELTPEQEAIRKEALGPLPAPCCSDFSMATCCCPCNLSRAIWGLSKHLIVDLGHDADTVRAEVQSWLASIRPDGWDGEVCGTGRCAVPMRDGGCGGMNPAHIIF